MRNTFLILLLLLAPVTGQPLEVLVEGAARAEVMVPGPKGGWRAAGRTGEVLILESGEYKRNRYIGGITVENAIVKGEGLLPVRQELFGKLPEPVRMRASVVPTAISVALQTRPAICSVYADKPGKQESTALSGSATLTLTPSEFLPPVLSLKGVGPVYKLVPLQVVLKAPGYRDTPVELGPEVWASKVYPPDGVIELEPEKGVPALLRRNPGLIPVPLAVAVLLMLWGVQTRRRLKRGKKLEELRAQDDDPIAGSVLGSYRLGKLLGEGGMGAVYLSVPESTLDGKEAVAIKVIHRRYGRDEEFLQRFYREADVATSLVHPNIVECIEWGNQEGLLYLIMEFLEGEPLTRKVRPNAPLPEVIGYLAAVAKALSYSHGQGVVHRDIKPENVMLVNGRVKVMDFGLAKKLDASTITATGAIFGTPAYLPPEQALGQKIGPATDQYSFGVMAFELLTGRRPFQADEPMQLMLKQIRQAPPPLGELRPDIPSELVDMVNRLLAKDPNERFGTMDEVVAILEKFEAAPTSF